uniref:Hexosyltransferase n=1 Tax=Globodera pallida TaxID=36090 RepID=A0A183C5S8_GLOPA
MTDGKSHSRFFQQQQQMRRIARHHCNISAAVAVVVEVVGVCGATTVKQQFQFERNDHVGLPKFKQYSRIISSLRVERSAIISIINLERADEKSSSCPSLAALFSREENPSGGSSIRPSSASPTHQLPESRRSSSASLWPSIVSQWRSRVGGAGLVLLLLQFLWVPPYLCFANYLERCLLPLRVYCYTAPDFLAVRYIRDSWKPAVEKLNGPVVFVAGRDGTELAAENGEHGDILQLDFEDSYRNLTLKMMGIYRFFTESTHVQQIVRSPR